MVHGKAVLIDMDGTLINTAPLVGQVMSEVFRDLHGIERTPESCDIYVGPPLQWSFADAGVPQDRITETMVEYRKRYGERMFESAPFEGMVETIKLAKDFGLSTAIATSKVESAAKKIVDHWGFADLLDAVSGGDEAEQKSDKALVVDSAVARLEAQGLLDPANRVVPYEDEPTGERRDDVFLVGDRFYDIEGAAKANINTVLVSWGTKQPDEGEGAWKRVDTVDELQEIIREFAG